MKIKFSKGEKIMQYLADDEKIFKKENDCREYEESLKKIRSEWMI